MKVALIQMEICWGDVEANLQRLSERFSDDLGCDIILLPEMFAVGSLMTRKNSSETRSLFEKTALYWERICSAMTVWARRQNALVMGSAVCSEGDKLYNRMIAAMPDGGYLFYDKRHCFTTSGENEYITSGNRRQIFEFRGLKVATFICYDLRFPVWSRNREKYDLAVYVANWPTSRRDVWMTLLKARAVENQCYVAGVNCVGTDVDGLHYSGDSMLVDARGCIVASASPDNEEILKAEINIEQLSTLREKFPVLNDMDEFAIKI
ncbi:MAG: amidohydrolase [Culturomica sp.]|jgi:predicted amidohydrolase|nr:amidohydrolase [Culturomica sp.]